MNEREKSGHDDRLASLLGDAAPAAFGPGFGDRVRARLIAERAQTLPRALEQQFVRIVPLAAAAALLLAAFNWWGARETSKSTFDAALNLPQVSIAAAYASSTLFDATGARTELP
jgi:hypothetical protein